MRFSICAALLLLFALPAQAQTRDWQLMGANTNIRTYIDAETVKRSGDTATVQLLSILPEPVGQLYGVEVTVVYDCKQMRFRELGLIGYTAKGEVAAESPAKDPDAYFPTAPGAIDEDGRQYACFGKGGRGSIADPFADSAEAFGWGD